MARWRGESTADGEVDPLPVGDARPSEPAIPLHGAEAALGMKVSPVMLTCDAARARLSGGPRQRLPS
jgi:hypothetical protein